MNVEYLYGVRLFELIPVMLELLIYKVVMYHFLAVNFTHFTLSPPIESLQILPFLFLESVLYGHKCPTTALPWICLFIYAGKGAVRKCFYLFYVFLWAMT